MAKHIITWSYWLGLASAVICLVLRELNALGLFIPKVIQGQTFWYMSFFKGALLLFLIAIATEHYTRAQGQKSVTTPVSEFVTACDRELLVRGASAEQSN